MVVHKRMALAVVMAFIVFMPVGVRGDDLADLRIVFEKDIRLFNAKNTDAFVASSHDDVVLFGILSPFATKGKEDLQRVVRGYLEDHVRVIFKMVNPEFVIVNTSGLAWGAYTITEYPKVGPRESIHGRYTFTYTKSDGKWRLVALESVREV
jgi:ketosteroid isomerase-like protein